MQSFIMSRIEVLEETAAALIILLVVPTATLGEHAARAMTAIPYVITLTKTKVNACHNLGITKSPSGSAVSTTARDLMHQKLEITAPPTPTTARAADLDACKLKKLKNMNFIFCKLKT